MRGHTGQGAGGAGRKKHGVLGTVGGKTHFIFFRCAFTRQNIDEKIVFRSQP